MDQFKVNVSKEALEEFYGRELSGQEVETARGIVYKSSGTMLATDFPYLAESADGWKNCTGSDQYDLWDLPERPLSDFLPAVESIDYSKDVFQSTPRTWSGRAVVCKNCGIFYSSSSAHICVDSDGPGQHSEAVKAGLLKTGPASETPPDHDGLCCAECRLNVNCLIYGTVPFCAVFESMTTGLGVEGTILNRKETVPRVDGDGNFIGNRDAVTPNCALCNWALERTKSNGTPYATCMACGYLDAPGAHNTPECKALYKVKE